VFEKLKRGDSLKVEAPFGDFGLRDSTKPILFVAGFHRLRADPIDHRRHDDQSIERDATLYWGARQRAGLYSDLPSRWAKTNPRFRYVPVLSDASAPGHPA